MEHIADWLKKLCLSEYAQRFAENGIEIEVLSELTDQALKALVCLLVIAARCCGLLPKGPSFLR